MLFKIADLYFRMALLDICQEDSVRSCVLRRLETLFSLELLLDPIMTREQTRNLVHLLCHPKQLALAYLEEPLDDRQTMQRSLRNLDQWNLRVCWVEIKLLLDHPDAKPEVCSVYQQYHSVQLSLSNPFSASSVISRRKELKSE
jgi:hypothetical protein